VKQQQQGVTKGESEIICMHSDRQRPLQPEEIETLRDAILTRFYQKCFNEKTE